MTDLTNLLPEPCWSIVEDLLDYLYLEFFQFHVDNAVICFKVADILQIPYLARKAMKFIGFYLVMDSTPIFLRYTCRNLAVITMLAQAHQLSPGLEPIINSAVELVAEDFDKYSTEKLAALPTEILACVLSHSGLQAFPENVSHCVTACLRLANEKPDVEASEVFDLLMPHVCKIAPSDALYILSHAIALSRSEHCQACLSVIQSCFQSLNMSDIVTIPDHLVVCGFLDLDELQVDSEDVVFDAIRTYCEGREPRLSPEQMAEIWSTCRSSCLSRAKIDDMLSIEEIPTKWVKLGLAARIARDAGGHEALKTFILKHAQDDPGALIRMRLHDRPRKIEEIDLD